MSGYARSHVTWGSGLSSASHQGQPAVSRMALLEEQYLTLAMDIFALFTDSENNTLKSRAKFGAGGVSGRKRELAHPGAEDRSSATESLPFAQLPWNQVVALQESQAVAMWGRILRGALSVWNEHIPDQMTSLVHGRMRDEQLEIWNTFQEAVRGSDLPQALITGDRAVRYGADAGSARGRTEQGCGIPYVGPLPLRGATARGAGGVGVGFHGWRYEAHHARGGECTVAPSRFMQRAHVAGVLGRVDVRVLFGDAL